MSEAAELIRSMIGLGLSGIGRALNMGVFSFGADVAWVESDTGASRTGSEYAIHVQCPFRLTRGGRILVGSNDVLPSREVMTDPIGRDSEMESVTAFDVVADRIVKATQSSPLVVRDVRITKSGDLRVELSDRVAIEAFPASGSPSEAWRLFRRGGEHLVFPSDFDV